MIIEDLDGLDSRAHPDSIMNILATAWIDLDYGLWDCTNPEVEKMTGRALAGWAEKHDRPRYFPWDQKEFDRFWESP